MTPRRPKKEPTTAAEFAAWLQQDPEYQARIEWHERQRLRHKHQYDRAARRLIAELRNVGFPVDSVGDLYNKRMDYQDAILILLDWLPRTANLDVKESIVRALSVPFAKRVSARLLIQEFRKIPDSARHGVRWAMGNALSVVADDSVFDDIVELARDRAYGKDREMLALALANMKDSRAVDVLIDLLSDEEVAGHTVLGLGKLKASRAQAHIEPFLKHPKAWIRTEAKRALSRIDRSH